MEVHSKEVMTQVSSACPMCCYLLIRAWWWAGPEVWGAWLLTPDAEYYAVISVTRAELYSRASVMQSRVSWHQLIQCLQSLAPVSSHPLRPGAHYAGPSFPPVLCSALYICTVYYVCNGVGPRASCQWPSSVDNITQLGSVSGTRAAVSITPCQEQHRDPSWSSEDIRDILIIKNLCDPSESLFCPRLTAESREKVTKTV